MRNVKLVKSSFSRRIGCKNFVDYAGFESFEVIVVLVKHKRAQNAFVFVSDQIDNFLLQRF